MNVACKEPAVADIVVADASVPQQTVANNSDHWRNIDALRERVRAEAAQSDLAVVVESPNPGQLSIGAGLAVPVRGVCVHRTRQIRRLTVFIGHHQTTVAVRRVRDDIAPELDELGFSNSGASGFYASALLPSAMIGRSFELHVEVELDDDSLVQRDLGTIDIVEGRHQPLDIPEPVGADAIAIVMAAYRPEPDGFRQQIASIQAQTIKSWHLIIRDDGSDAASLSMMREVVEGDDRITLIQGGHNLGFYGNFEQALRRVPAWADFVALADQDDRWHENKLQVLVDTLKAGGGRMNLAYSDMRIVDADGQVISETYWRGRNNNYTDADVMMLANTVTGAAAMFRASLLGAILPFPDRIGDAFHDHWIAMSAMVRGPLGYVDQPLYDYVQHDRAVIGHSDFATPALSDRAIKAAKAPLKRSFWTSLKNRFVTGRRSALNIHRFECRRLELIADTLVARHPLMSSAMLKSLNTYGRGVGSGMSLLFKHVPIVLGKHSTNDAEVRLGLGYLVYALDPLLARLRSLVGRVSRRGDA